VAIRNLCLGGVCVLLWWVYCWLVVLVIVFGSLVWSLMICMILILFIFIFIYLSACFMLPLGWVEVVVINVLLICCWLLNCYKMLYRCLTVGFGWGIY